MKWVMCLLAGMSGGIFAHYIESPKVYQSSHGWEIRGIRAPECPDRAVRKVYPDYDESNTLSISCEVR